MDASPMVARPGQKVTLRYRLLGNMDEVRIILNDNSEIPLKDEGNGVFSTEFIAPSTTLRDAFSPHLGTVRGYLGKDQKCYSNTIINIITDDVPRARITRMANDAQASDFLVNLAVPSAQLPSLSALTFSFDPAPIAKRFYQLYGDDYDMLNFILVPGFYENRYHVVVKNTVQGLGLSPTDNTAQLGSKGRLIGYNVFPLFFFFDGAESGATHEIGHQWAVHFSKPPFTVTPHWPASSMASGIMGVGRAVGGQGEEFPCLIRKSGNNVVTSPGLQFVFTDLDLYLMGLIPASDVGENYVVTDKTLADALDSQCGARTLDPSQYTTIRMADLVRDYGARSPAASGQPLSLRIANILITRDKLADADTMSLTEFYARRFQERSSPPTKVGAARRLGAPFYLATGKRGTVSTQITSTVLPEISAGGVVNAASFSGNRFAPGSVLSLFGTNLSATTAQADSVPLPTTLAGVQLMVNGKPAPLFYVSPGQINFQLPWELNATNETFPTSPGGSFVPAYSVRVQNGQLSSNVAILDGQADAPAVMVYGDNYPVAQDSRYNVIGPSNPAKPGDTITVYYIGARSLRSNPPASGDAAPLDRFIQAGGGTAVVGTQAAAVTFTGLTPGGVGLQQMNFRIPAMSRGTYDLKITINSVPANTTKLTVGE